MTYTSTLGSGAGADVFVRVTLPLEALAGESDTTIVTATSQADALVAAASLLTTTANAIYGFDVTPVVTQQIGLLGQAVTYTLCFSNTGNATDRYTITHAGNTWPVLISTEDITLTASASVSVTIRTTVPMTAIPASTDTVTITLASAGLPAQTREVDLITTAAGYRLLLPMIVNVSETVPPSGIRLPRSPRLRKSS
jgi:hypothetical protein